MTQSPVSRRSFLSVTGGAVAGAVLSARPLGAAVPLWRFSAKFTGTTTPAEWLPDPISPDMLRALATQAIDAARQAGASFADIRIGESRQFELSRGVIPRVESHVGYSVRVLVNGARGFVHGQVLTPDAVTGVARQAVSVARGYAAVNASVGATPVMMVPVPVVKGEWTNPVEIDPFSVPIDDHFRWQFAMDHAADAIYGVICQFNAAWSVGTRVYASTEESLITQRVTRGDMGVTVRTWVGRDTLPALDAGMGVQGFNAATGGFELVLVPDLPDRIVATAHEVIRRSEIPKSRFKDVGRFSVVCDGETMAQMAGLTVGSLLDSDRASGAEVDASGTTYLIPPAAIRAAAEAPFSSLLTVTADRAMPGPTAMKWDDEGVTTGTLTLVKNGHVQNYLTTRETAAMNGASTMHDAPTLVGCMTAPSEDALPLVGGMHLTIAPGKSTATVNDLIKDVTHGFLVRGGNASLEPGLTSGTFGGDVYEIRRGREVAHLGNLEMPFRTRHLWKEQLHTLGDASTVMTTGYRGSKGMPWQEVSNVGTAPAALFTDVDVTRTDFKLD